MQQKRCVSGHARVRLPIQTSVAHSIGFAPSERLSYAPRISVQPRQASITSTPVGPGTSAPTMARNSTVTQVAHMPLGGVS